MLSFEIELGLGLSGCSAVWSRGGERQAGSTIMLGCWAGFTVELGLVLDLDGPGGHPAALLFLLGTVCSGSLTPFSRGFVSRFHSTWPIGP